MGHLSRSYAMRMTPVCRAFLLLGVLLLPSCATARAAQQASGDPDEAAPAATPQSRPAGEQTFREAEDFATLQKADQAVRDELAKRIQRLPRLMQEHDALMKRLHERPDADERAAAPNTLKAQVEAKAAEIKQARDQILKIIADVRARYDAFFAKYPKNYEAHYLLGDLYDDVINWPDEAAEQWRITIRIAPNWAPGYFALGTVYSHSARYMETLDLFRKAIELNPDKGLYHYYLAVMYSTTYHEAARKYGWNLPRVFREALAAYGRARDLEPDNYEYARNYATTFVLAKHFHVTDTADEAIAAWQRCLTLKLTDSQQSYVLRNIGRLYLRDKEDKVNARVLLRAARDLDDNPTTRTLLEQASR